MSTQPKPDTRPVWLNVRLAGAIAYAEARAKADWKDDSHAAELREIIDAWDAAPADATEAIRLALAPLHDLALVPANGSSLVRAASTSVAIALGMPDA